jgi:hypothetical protein
VVAIQIEMPAEADALSEFIRFHDRVYECRSARWPAAHRRQLHILTAQPPYDTGREIKCFVAREGGAIVARIAAIVDHHYIAHWNEPLGHLMMFEAMPNAGDAVRLMTDVACEWLRTRGMKAGRAGATALLDEPFAIDEYEMLPPSIVRQNPGYYHALLKNTGFETERGWVDYKIEVTPALIARYESMLEAARRADFRIAPATELEAGTRVRHFSTIWNDAFAHHWGMAPRREAEVAAMFASFAPGRGLDTTVIAYRGEEPVGVLVALRSSTDAVILAPGRQVRASEKLNWLGIGVHESARGRGVNLAMASYVYLELIRQGAKYLSYTLVLDDNWPSRRTAEKLGAKVCASYVTYRRNF